VNLDDRLRAASRALKDGSVAQVDAASRLREIVRHAGRAVTHGHAPLLPDEPWETPELLEASLVPPAPPRPGPQRLALVVNLMLVLGLGVVLGVAASYVLDADRTAPASAASTTPASMASTVVAHPHPTRVQAPEACLEAAALADEVISRLNRNERDNRLAEALRDYTIASQACRRAASP
jgi:hypothetical protein